MNRQNELREAVKFMRATGVSVRYLLAYDAYVRAVESTPKAFSEVAALAIQAISRARRA